jgi:hypothetical protein
MNYYNDIFYDVYSLDFETKKEIINWSFKNKKYWSVDKLDCSVSFARKKVEMSFEDILNKFNNSSHFIVIHRRGYVDRKEDWKLEIGFRTMESPDYFLFIWCDEKLVGDLEKKFNLKKL